jgi:signal transduction histidine kinase
LTSTKRDIQADIEAIRSIDAIPSILEVICRTTGMGFAAVARVTEDKWVACAVRDEINFGLVPGGELSLETTICNEIRYHRNAVVIDHVATNEAYAQHHTPLMYGFQSYISMPITLKNGDFFGTLCAIDPKPAKLENSEAVGMLKLFADLIAFHLNTIEQLALTESDLLEERQTSELRDQFIAILGHDLRNPVGAVLNVAQMLLRMPLDERVKRLANILQDASYRMKGLIENILDFARGRLGDGITLDRKAGEPIQQILGQVITELDMMWPDRVIEVSYDLKADVNCDSRRIAQMLSNLLGNALTHGKKATPVNVHITSNADEFTLSVTNFGRQIPEAVMHKLFEPFSRGEIEPNQQGLGLGLYISMQIARAHGGTLSVISGPDETCFTFRMPIQAVEL